MSRTMSPEEIYAYIEEKPRTAHLAVVRKDGRPHVSVIWVIVDGEDIVFTSWHTSVKGHALARTGQAALSVDDTAEGSSYVTIEGTVTIDPDPEQSRIWATRLGGKYMGADRAKEFGARNGIPGEYVYRLTPARMSGARGITD
ncbi:MAG TPA: PPOX class F420-dependent oxidoreductase [Thermomicrobiales bacterium]|nr:PPOX class F420-dependent oxidoreductase [Thermomicrobiales bacterium]